MTSDIEFRLTMEPRKTAFFLGRGFGETKGSGADTRRRGSFRSTCSCKLFEVESSVKARATSSEHVHFSVNQAKSSQQSVYNEFSLTLFWVAVVSLLNGLQIAFRTGRLERRQWQRSKDGIIAFVAGRTLPRIVHGGFTPPLLVFFGKEKIFDS